MFSFHEAAEAVFGAAVAIGPAGRRLRWLRRQRQRGELDPTRR